MTEQRAVGLVFGHPPLGTVRRQMTEERLEHSPELLRIEAPRVTLTPKQVLHRRHGKIEDAARVGRRPASNRGLGARHGLGIAQQVSRRVERRQRWLSAGTRLE